MKTVFILTESDLYEGTPTTYGIFTSLKKAIKEGSNITTQLEYFNFFDFTIEEIKVNSTENILINSYDLNGKII